MQKASWRWAVSRETRPPASKTAICRAVVVAPTAGPKQRRLPPPPPSPQPPLPFRKPPPAHPKTPIIAPQKTPQNTPKHHFYHPQTTVLYPGKARVRFEGVFEGGHQLEAHLFARLVEPRVRRGPFNGHGRRCGRGQDGYDGLGVGPAGQDGPEAHRHRHPRDQLLDLLPDAVDGVDGGEFFFREAASFFRRRRGAFSSSFSLALFFTHPPPLLNHPNRQKNPL